MAGSALGAHRLPDLGSRGALPADHEPTGRVTTPRRAAASRLLPSDIFRPAARNRDAHRSQTAGLLNGRGAGLEINLRVSEDQNGSAPGTSASTGARAHKIVRTDLTAWMVGGLDDGAFAHQTPTLRPTAKPDPVRRVRVVVVGGERICEGDVSVGQRRRRPGWAPRRWVAGSPRTRARASWRARMAISTLAAASVGAPMSAIAPGRADKPRASLVRTR